MKHLLLGGLVITCLTFPAAANMDVEITLVGSTLEHAGTIYFDGDDVIADGRHDINSITKISFNHEKNKGSIVPTSIQKGISQVSKQNLTMSVHGQSLGLSLVEPANLKVSLYSMNGRRVAELFSGYTSESSVNLDLSNSQLAAGIYSVVINANNTQLNQKIAIQ